MKRKLVSIVTILAILFTTVFCSNVTAFAEPKTYTNEELCFDPSTGVVEIVEGEGYDEHCMEDFGDGTSKWYGNTDIKTVIIDETITYVGAFSFQDCTNIRSISLSPDVTTIGTAAFMGCSGLTNIVIPSSVTTISDEAFMDCTGLTSIVFSGNNLPTIGTDAFKNIPSTCIVYAYGSLTATIKAWENVFPEDITIIDYNEPQYYASEDYEARNDALIATSDIGTVYIDATIALESKKTELLDSYNKVQKAITYSLSPEETEALEKVGVAYFNAVDEDAKYNSADKYQKLTDLYDILLTEITKYNSENNRYKNITLGVVGEKAIEALTLATDETEEDNIRAYLNIIMAILETQGDEIACTAIGEVGEAFYDAYMNDLSDAIYTDKLIPVSNILLERIDKGNDIERNFVGKISDAFFRNIPYTDDTTYQELIAAFNILDTGIQDRSEVEAEGVIAIGNEIFDALVCSSAYVGCEDTGWEAYSAEMVELDATLIFDRLIGYINSAFSTNDQNLEDERCTEYEFKIACETAAYAIYETSHDPSYSSYIPILTYFNLVLADAHNMSTDNASDDKDRDVTVIRLVADFMDLINLKDYEASDNYIAAITNLVFTEIKNWDSRQLTYFETYIVPQITYLVGDSDHENNDDLDMITSALNLFITEYNKNDNSQKFYSVALVTGEYLDALNNNRSEKTNLDSMLSLVYATFHTFEDEIVWSEIAAFSKSMFSAMREAPSYYEDYISAFSVYPAKLYDGAWKQNYAVVGIAGSYFNVAPMVFAAGKKSEIDALSNLMLSVNTESDKSYFLNYISSDAFDSLMMNINVEGAGDKIRGVVNLSSMVYDTKSDNCYISLAIITNAALRAYATNYSDSEDLDAMLNICYSLITKDNSEYEYYDRNYNIALVSDEWFLAYQQDKANKDVYQAKFNIIIDSMTDKTSSELSAISSVGTFWLNQLVEDDLTTNDRYDELYSAFIKYLDGVDNEDTVGYANITNNVISGISEAKYNSDTDLYNKLLEAYGVICGEVNRLAHFDDEEYYYYYSSYYYEDRISPLDVMGGNFNEGIDVNYTSHVISKIVSNKAKYETIMFLNKVVDEAIRIDALVSIRWQGSHYWLGTYNDVCRDSYNENPSSQAGTFLGWECSGFAFGSGIIDDVWLTPVYDNNPGGGGGDDPYVPSDPDDPDDPTPQPSKQDPTYTVPTGLTAYVGDTLADVPLPSGFTYQDQTTTSVGPAGTNTFKVTYTPTDTTTYNVVKNIDVKIEVKKKESTYTVPTNLVATYGDEISTISLPSGFTFQDDPTTYINEVGEIELKVTYTPEDTDTYETVKDIVVKVNVSKANPTYEVPELVAVKGDTLGDIELPEGFTFEDSLTKSVGSVGEHTVKLTYTPADTDHYNVITGIEAKLTVVKTEDEKDTIEDEIEKAASKVDPDYDVPELVAVKGQKLGDLSLPEGFTFEDKLTKSVGSVGKHTVKLTYTPADTDKYNIITGIDAPLTVVKTEDEKDALEEEILENNSKLDPSYDVPKLVALKGQKLSDIELPEGFTFEADLKTSVGSVGKHAVKLTYTPNDTDKYKTVSGIKAILTVVDTEEEKESLEAEIKKEQENKKEIAYLVDADKYKDDVELIVKLIVTTSEVEKKSSFNYNNISDENLKLKDNEEVGLVFDAKLYKTVNGVTSEIQPSDLDGVTSIKVKMLIPENVDIDKITRILHVHNDETIDEYVFDKSKIDAERYYELEISKLSEFAYVTEKGAITEVDTEDVDDIEELVSDDGCKVHILFMIYAAILLIGSIIAIFNKKNKLGNILAGVFAAAVIITSFFMGCSTCTTWLIIDIALLALGILVTLFKKKNA